MKRTADALRKVGHTISPAQLVLNLLRGLNSCFANTADIIANTSPLPNFMSATNMLRVKELRLGTEGKEALASALAASTTSSCTSLPCQTTSSASTNRGGGGKGKGGKGKGGRSGNGGGGHNQQQGGGCTSLPCQTTSSASTNRGGGGKGKGDKGKGGRSGNGGGGRNQQQGGGFGGRQAPQPAGPWVCYNPWAIQWPSQQQQQWGAPFAPPPQAHTAFSPTQFSTAGGPLVYAPPGSWDQTSLIAALNQMAIQGGSAPWVMDSGATSHMSSNDGILLSRLPSPPSSITVGNGQSIPVFSRGTSCIQIADRPFHLDNVLVAPQLTRNLFNCLLR
jgi:hypothetical protein